MRLEKTKNVDMIHLYNTSMLFNNSTQFAKVAELVDALDLGSSGATRESSSLSFRTIIPFKKTIAVFYISFLFEFNNDICSVR